MSEPIKIDKYLSYHYGGASGDLNLIHIDNEFARASGLDGIILQGLCTMGNQSEEEVITKGRALYR